MELKFMISEPFEFKSSEEDDSLRVKFIKMLDDDFICECVSEFENMTRYLLLQYRYSGAAYNVYKCGNELNKISKDNLEFIIIGDFADRNAFWEEVKKAGYFSDNPYNNIP